MRRILAAAVLLVLGGCASSGMDKAECRMADWRAIGYEDGARGAGADSFGLRRKACAGHGVAAKFDDYLVGHAQGLEVFCRPQNGYRLGTGGYRYSGVCPAHLEGPFLAAHTDGYGLYERQATLNNISRQLQYSRARSKEIEYLVVEKTALLVSPTVLPTERATIAVELKQLAEEKVEVEQSIRRLERDHAKAERNYQNYRSQFANRY